MTHFPLSGEAVYCSDLPPDCRAAMLAATAGQMVAGRHPGRRTVEAYLVVSPGLTGHCVFLGYLSPLPLPTKERET